ncbi:nacht and ankyrin domain-containing protein [Xylaria cubensis]|nr:nacht and ankyrin domain-containing protein [Xylaria cubensis]
MTGNALTLGSVSVGTATASGNSSQFIGSTNIQNFYSGLPESEEFQKVTLWLSSLNFPAKQRDLLNRHQAGTGRWLLSNPRFKCWLDGKERTLWCPGPPGAGKTTLASMVIDWLEHQHGGPHVAVIYIYCNYKEDQSQTLPDIIGSLLKQLSQHRRTLSDDIRGTYKTHLREETRPGVDELTQLLVKEVTNFSSVFVVIDALDECSERDDTRTRLLAEMQKLPQHARILITSRYSSKFQEAFENVPQIEIKAIDDDVEIYVKACIEEGKWTARNARSNAKLIQEVTKTVKRNSDGMFLLAQLHMANLMGCLTLREIRRELKILPTSLDETYNQAMQRIKNQDRGQVTLAHKVLYWISHAFRLLTVPELRHALAVEIGDEDVDEDGLYDLELMVSVCAGLVTVDEESNHIRLVHYTTQDYFERTRKDWFPEALSTMSKICLTYLKFRPFATTFDLESWEPPARHDQYPFLWYAARYWGHHAHDGMDNTVRELALEYLRNDSNIWNIRRMTDFRYDIAGIKFRSDWLRDGFNRLHVIAPFDLADIAEDCQAENIEVDARLQSNETPLYLAARAGQAQMVRFLLRAGAKVKADYGRTPLQVAIHNGDKTIVRLLAEAGADVNGCIAPVFRAARSGHLDIVQTLMKHGADISARNGWNGTPLHAALRAGHTKIAEILIASGVDISAKNRGEKTALHHAAKRGQEDVVQLLLKNGADVLAEDRSGKTAIQKAAQYGHEKLVKILLERIGSGAEAESWRMNMRLFRAVDREDEKEVGLLLKMGADPNLKLFSDLSLLKHAVLRGTTKVMELLLSNGACVNNTGKFGETSLHWAAHRGFDIGVQLLLDYDADIQATDNQGATPLHMAVGYGGLAVVNKLLDGGARLDVKDLRGNPLLAWALRSVMGYAHEMHLSYLVTKYGFPSHDQREDVEKRLDVLDFLIKKGADLHAQQSSTGTALSLVIAEYPETERIALLRRLLEEKAQATGDSSGLFQLLLKHGAEVNEPNIEGETALH